MARRLSADGTTMRGAGPARHPRIARPPGPRSFAPSLCPEPAVSRSLLAVAALTLAAHAAAAQRFSVTVPAARTTTPLDGRLLVMISADTTGEPRTQVSDAVTTAQLFGVDVDGWRAGTV